MMKIGICDDEQHIHEKVTKLLLLYSEEKQIMIDVVHYYSASQLLDKMQELDLLFLDIEMPEMDGVEAAYRLRDWGIDYKIIMLTAKVERFKDAFRIGAFRFVSKPIEKQEFDHAIDDVREHMVGMKTVTVFRDGISYNIVQKDILYIEADRSATLIYTNNSEYRSEYSLAMWMERLDNRMFFQSHRSFVVNMGKIDKIDKNVIRLMNGDLVEVSRRLRTPLLQAYMLYDVKRR